MAYIYYQLILNGSKTIEDVPKRLRSEVETMLRENGYSELAN